MLRRRVARVTQSQCNGSACDGVIPGWQQSNSSVARVELCSVETEEHCSDVQVSVQETLQQQLVTRRLPGTALWLKWVLIQQRCIAIVTTLLQLTTATWVLQSSSVCQWIQIFVSSYHWFTSQWFFSCRPKLKVYCLYFYDVLLCFRSIKSFDEKQS